MKTFFTSDTHFGHENIIKYCDRPFSSVEEMDEAMIANWNAVVGKNDRVFHLGDFAFGDEPGKYSDRLNGMVYWVQGNHDDRIEAAYIQEEGFANWTRLGPMAETTVQGQRIVLCHYGLRTWRHDLRGVWHLYGHSHGGLPPLGKSCDIGVDTWNFRPIEFADLKRYMDAREVHEAAFAGYVPKEPA